MDGWTRRTLRGSALLARAAFASGARWAACATASLLLAGPEVHAQARLEQLDPTATKEWDVTLQVKPGERFCVLADRVALLSEDGHSIRLHGTDGRLLHQVPSDVRLSGIAASPRGTHLLGAASYDEDEHYASVRDSEGRPLWSLKLGTGLRFSPSGRFLVTSFDGLDASQRPTVYHVDTGRTVWEGESRRHYWSLAASETDRLAYYRIGALKVFDLSTGAVLWEAEVPADPDHDLGEVTIARNGKTVVVQTRASVGAREERVTQVFGAQGERLWERRVEPVTGVTNGGVVRAISDDGALIALEDLEELVIHRASDGRELSRLKPRPRGIVTAFTGDLLALNLLSRTRLLLLREGAVVGDHTIAEPLDFAQRLAGGSVAGAEVATASSEAFFPIAVTRSADTLRVSRSRFRPQPQLRPHGPVSNRSDSWETPR